MSTVDETVTIPIREYKTLLKAKLMLDALETAGVDNWEGRSALDWDALEIAEAEIDGGLFR